MRHLVPAIFGDQIERIKCDEITDHDVHSVLRKHEFHPGAHRDEWGNSDIQIGPEMDGFAVPTFDRHIVPGSAKWPGGAAFAVCVTHDLDAIDRYSWAEYRIRIARAPIASKFRSLLGYIKNRIILRRREDWSFGDWLELERRYGVRATWFVPPEDPRHPSPHDCSYSYNHLVQYEIGDWIQFDKALLRLTQEGHEIGLHGSISSALDSAELKRQRLKLSETIKKPVNALRMHYLRFDPVRTPRIVADAGFQADSTIGFNRGVGFRASTSLPHRLMDPQTNEFLSVIEVPFQIQEGALFRNWCLGLNVEQAKARTSQIVDAVERAGGVLGLVYHPHLFGIPEVQEHFCWMLEELKRRNAAFITTTEAAQMVDSAINTCGL